MIYLEIDMSIVYTNLYEINPLQQTIIKYILYWVQTRKVPVPQKEILREMARDGGKRSTIIHSLDGLLRLGYIRRAIVKPSNTTSYVLLRTI